jgi:RNA polymerase sigma-70 factor (ECF subfamily)
VRLYKVRHKYELRARFTTFLYVLARHVWADRGRQAARRDRLCACLKTDADIAVDVPPARRPAGLDVEEALGKLSPKLREALVLNIYQGLRYQEIADVLGLPLGTVKSRIHLALQALRESFNEQES